MQISRITKTMVLGLTGVLGLALICATLYWVPLALVHTDLAKNSAEFAGLVDKYRSTLAQILAGLFVLAGLYFTARNVFAAEQTRWTKTFSDAISQLGAIDSAGQPDISIRVGALYSLERLSRDSPADIPAIHNVLLQYVQARANVKLTDSPLLDCEAALTALGSLGKALPQGGHEGTFLYDVALLNLKLTNRRLWRLYFKIAVLDGSRFDGSWCPHLMIESGSLNGCSFARCKSDGMQLNNCSGEGISLSESIAPKSRFLTCTFRDGDFTYSRLADSDLADCDFTGSDFSNSDLRGVIISRCVMTNVRFDNADLEGSDLRTATGISLAALKAMKTPPSPSMLPEEWA